MTSVNCYRCSQRRSSTDEVRCFYCDNDEAPRPPITSKSIPVVPVPGNGSRVYYVSDASTQTTDDDFLLLEPIRDASTQTTDEDFLLLEPIQDASTQTTDSDFSYLAQIVGYHEYAGHEIVFISQVTASQVFDQNCVENHNLSPENMDINNEDFHIMNIDGYNNATIGPLPESMNDSHVLPKKRAYIDEEPPSNEIQNISNRYKLLKTQGTEYSEQENEAGKLNFVGSISLLSEYESSNTNKDSAGNVNKPGGSPGNSNSSVVLARRGNNPSIKDRLLKNVDPTKAVLEQCVQNSSKSARNVFKQRVSGVRFLSCRKCGKGYNKEWILKFHVENNCDLEPHKCDQCEMKFPYESNLRIHQRVHTTVFEQRVPAKRAQICGKCGKGFLNESIFKFHVENNCDPKPYKCDQCEKKFPKKSALRIHQRVHTTDKPFKCDQCPYASKWNENLKVHKKRYH